MAKVARENLDKAEEKIAQNKEDKTAKKEAKKKSDAEKANKKDQAENTNDVTKNAKASSASGGKNHRGFLSFGVIYQVRADRFVSVLTQKQVQLTLKTNPINIKE